MNCIGQIYYICLSFTPISYKGTTALPAKPDVHQWAVLSVSDIKRAWKKELAVRLRKYVLHGLVD